MEINELISMLSGRIERERSLISERERKLAIDKADLANAIRTIEMMIKSNLVDTGVSNISLSVDKD